MTAPLQIDGLRHYFGRLCALDGIDLEVGEDELLVVLGPTGAGKTTLLRSIAGLERPAAGGVRLHGQDVTTWSPARRDVSLVFQNFSLYPGWTVRRNLAFPLRAPGRGLDGDQIEGRVAWAAELLRILHLLDRPAESLSGGEMQRVAIGRAIVRRPRLFLMDEPLTNLDAKLREQLRVELVVLRRELGIPMVYVTHDQEEAMSMGDRVAVLAAGRILQTGTPQDIYARPASPQVARQLGQPQINLIRVRRQGRRWLSLEGGVPVMEAEGELEGGAIPGTVKVVEDTGPAQILVVDWLAGEPPLHLLLEKGGHTWRPGEPISPRLDPARALLWPEAP